MSDCIFCRILAGELPASFVYRDEQCAAFMDIRPALRASGLPCEGVNLFLADGEAAMQEIFHVHLHVFPRFRGDGFGLKFSAEYYTRRPAREELDATAAKISAAFNTNAPRSSADAKSTLPDAPLAMSISRLM
jgi:histidine triad (HIT) family protein